MRIRRVSEQLLLLVALCALTYVPFLHISYELQEKIFGLLIIVMFSSIRSWTIKFSKKVLPSDQLKRTEDKK